MVVAEVIGAQIFLVFVFHILVPSEEEQEGAVQRMLNYIHQMPFQETFQPPALPCVSFTSDEANVKCHSCHSKILSALMSFFFIIYFNLVLLPSHNFIINMVTIFIIRELEDDHLGMVNLNSFVVHNLQKILDVKTLVFYLRCLISDTSSLTSDKFQTNNLNILLKHK